MELGFHYAVVLPYAGALLVLASLARLLTGGRVEEVERLLYYGLAVLALGWLVYMIPFARLDYTLAEVARNANDDLSLPIRLATSWSGGGGSLYLYTAMMSAALLYTLRSTRRGHTSSRAFLLVSAAVVLVTFASAVLNGAFDVWKSDVRGFGLNPLLKNYWVIPHPLTTFGGYALLVAGAIAIAVAGERARGITVFVLGWSLLTFGIMFGAIWSYETFGWGGYWAWDPVEISELTVWLAATASLHMVGPLQPLNRGFTLVAMSTALFAPYVTRSGLSPLHSFAAADIGSIILLAAGVAVLAYAVYELASVASSGGLGIPRRHGSIDVAGLAVVMGGGALALMALFVYASLLVPGVLTALGKNASVPTMRQGVEFYHPVLYPLFLYSILWLPGYFLYKQIGDKGFKALLTVALITGAVAGIAVHEGTITPLPGAPAETNLRAAIGITVSSIMLAALVVGVLLDAASPRARRKPTWLRDVLLKTLHIGMLAAFIGVLVSGTYAFNDYFFQTYTVYPETPTEAGPVKIWVDDYSYSLHSGSIDLKSHLPPTSLIAGASWLGLNMLLQDVGAAVQELHFAMQQVEANETYQELTSILVNNPTIRLGNITLTANATVSTVNVTTGTVNVVAENASLEIVLENATIQLGIAPVPSDQGGLLGAWIISAITAEKASIWGVPGEALNIGFHTPLEVNLSQPLVLGGNTGYNVEVASIRLYAGSTGEGSAPVIVYENGTTIKNPYVEVASGRLLLSTGAIPVPVPTGPGYYLLVELERGSLPDLEAVINSSLDEALLGITSLDALLGPTIGELPSLPRSAPSGVSMDVRLGIEVGGERIYKDTRIRFEANGEAAGIHGLVSPAVMVRRGLSDVYISVHPPMVEGLYDRYHEPLIMYMSHAVKVLPREEALTLAAVMSSGYNINELSRVDINHAGFIVEQGIVDLYILGEKADGRAVESSGIPVMVKVVPGVNLVWIGVTIMGLSGMLLSAYYGYKARMSG